MKKTIKLMKVLFIITVCSICARLGAQPVNGSGTIKYIPIFTGPSLIGNSQIYDNGSSGVGIGTITPSSYLHLLVPGVSSTAEKALEIHINESGTPGADFFKLYNGTTLNGTFTPTLWGHCESVDSRVGLAILGSTNSTNDAGSTAMIDFDARIYTSGSYTSVLNRPLFLWSNLGTAQMQMNATGYLGIGTTSAVAQLHVVNSSSGGSSNFVDIQGDLTNTSRYTLNAVAGNATNSSNSIGVSGTSITTGDTGIGIGTQGIATSHDTDGVYLRGLYGKAQSDTGAFNSTVYGIYTETGNSPTSGTNSVFAAYFNGAAHCTGGVWTSSDMKLKSNITPLSNGLENIMKLQPKTYDYNHKNFPSMNFPEGQQIGFIAQDLEKVYPNLVKFTRQPSVRDNNGKVTPSVEFKSVNYTALIPVVVSGIQEQQAQIQKQQIQIEEQQNQITELKNAIAVLQGVQPSNGTPNNGSNPILNKAVPQLFQNTPNPAAGGTRIDYFLPTNITNAVIYIYTLQGQQVGKYIVSSTGNGSIQLNPGDYVAGSYIYTMIANGSEVATKKMILTQ
jgi:hypothetical protein